MFIKQKKMAIIFVFFHIKNICCCFGCFSYFDYVFLFRQITIIKNLWFEKKGLSKYDINHKQGGKNELDIDMTLVKVRSNNWILGLSLYYLLIDILDKHINQITQIYEICQNIYSFFFLFLFERVINIFFQPKNHKIFFWILLP